MLKQVITECEYKTKDGMCSCQGRQNLVDTVSDHPPILTPVMALTNHQNDKFIVNTVPEWAIAPRNLPEYVVFADNPTDDRYRAWVPSQFMSGAVLSSFDTIGEIHLRFYPDLPISKVPLIPESLLFSVFMEARVGSFSSTANKELAVKFNILGFGEPGDYVYGLTYRVKAAKNKGE